MGSNHRGMKVSELPPKDGLNLEGKYERGGEECHSILTKLLLKK